MNSVGVRFPASCASLGDAEAFRYPARPGWSALTRHDLATRTKASAGLLALGVTAGQRVGEVSAGRNRWETIKQFRILPGEFSVEAGEITPSRKAKRAVVARTHADLIESIYAESNL